VTNAKFNFNNFSVDDPAKWQAIAGRHNKEGTEANQQIRQISNIIKFPNPGSSTLKLLKLNFALVTEINYKQSAKHLLHIIICY
jgi:hypothetical protein